MHVVRLYVYNADNDSSLNSYIAHTLFIHYACIAPNTSFLGSHSRHHISKAKTEKELEYIYILKKNVFYFLFISAKENIYFQ